MRVKDLFDKCKRIRHEQLSKHELGAVHDFLKTIFWEVVNIQELLMSLSKWRYDSLLTIFVFDFNSEFISFRNCSASSSFKLKKNMLFQESFSYFKCLCFLPRLVPTFPITIRDHPFSAYAKFSEKLTFLTTWYAHVRVRIRVQKCYYFGTFCVRTKWMIGNAFPQFATIPANY